MLNGIGGRTIREAKNNLTEAESREWYRYFQKRGSLNVSRHLEFGFALLAQYICKSGGIKFNNGPADMKMFMPYEYPHGREADTDGTIEDVFTLFQSLKKDG